MGGFSAQVQQPQSSQPSGGKGMGRSDGLDQNAINANPQGFQQWQQDKQNFEMQQAPQPMGKGGTQTNSATSGQPRMGMPNRYPNTVGQWDNAQIQPQQPSYGGKGKG